MTPLPPEEKRYAEVLHWGSLAGFATLVVTFLLDLTGFVDNRPPLADLPRLWTLSTSDYLAATHVAGGWQWTTTLGRGDSLSLMGIAILSACPILSIAAVIPLYLRERNYVYATLCLATVAVLLVAASGTAILSRL